MPDAYPLHGVHSFLTRQAKFAEKQEIVSWGVAIAIARILLYLAADRRSEALKILDKALRTAAPTGFFRIFVDECESLEFLLQELKQRSTDGALTEYASRLLNASNSELSKPPATIQPEAVLSDRELEVLQDLAQGLSYEEIGRHLYLSLNTIQFHVKNIYRKLLVNKRVHAIKKAREMGLI
jgi:LuxR family maltose regulon positive regulatory protein